MVKKGKYCGLAGPRGGVVRGVDAAPLNSVPSAVGIDFRNLETLVLLGCIKATMSNQNGMTMRISRVCESRVGWRKAAVAMVAAALFAGACGGGDDGESALRADAVSGTEFCTSISEGIAASERATGSSDPDVIGDQRVAYDCLLYTSPSPRDATLSRMPSSA